MEAIPEPQCSRNREYDCVGRQEKTQKVLDRQIENSDAAPRKTRVGLERRIRNKEQQQERQGEQRDASNRD
jgi:hypothetical protein